MDCEKIIRERRGKVIYIPKEEILNCFISGKEFFQHEFEIIRKIRLPENWLLRDVFYDPLRDSFAFLIFSKDFPPVKKGKEYPAIENSQQIFIDIRKLKNQKNEIRTFYSTRGASR